MKDPRLCLCPLRRLQRSVSVNLCALCRRRGRRFQTRTKAIGRLTLGSGHRPTRCSQERCFLQLRAGRRGRAVEARLFLFGPGPLAGSMGHSLQGPFLFEPPPLEQPLRTEPHGVVGQKERNYEVLMSTPQVTPRKYRIERYLAEGGMGAIYLGKKLGPGGFEKELVLKQLLPEFTSRPEFRDLFFREAKISATLDHTNIVRTFDLVRSEDALFIVMEYVRGTDLRTIAWRARRKRRALSHAAVLHVAMEILAGLSYAHSRRSARGEPLGIIHRDVSPSNILCSAQGEVKLSDFGIAKAVTYSSAFYRVRGKVGYMSPEQARNQPIDSRSDLFSLAVCIFETLLGERLYTGDLQTPADVVYAQPIPSLSESCPDLPPEIEGVLRHALAHDPDRRFPDAATFAQALRQVTRRHGLSYSAPALAAELANLMGANADRWLVEESAISVVTEGMPEPRELEGKEAASVGIVDDISGPIPRGVDSATVPILTNAASAMGAAPERARTETPFPIGTPWHDPQHMDTRAVSGSLNAPASLYQPADATATEATGLVSALDTPSGPSRWGRLRRYFPRPLSRRVWVASAAVLMALLAAGILASATGGPVGSAVKSVRHTIAP